MFGERICVLLMSVDHVGESQWQSMSGFNVFPRHAFFNLVYFVVGSFYFGTVFVVREPRWAYFTLRRENESCVKILLYLIFINTYTDLGVTKTSLWIVRLFYRFNFHYQ